MALIVKALISALFVGTLGVVIYIQRNSLAETTARAERAENNVRDRDDAIKTLKQISERNAKAAARLQAERNRIHATLSERETMIENLQHENATIRHWSESPLPDAIAGMRERPALSGADAYHQRLPPRDTLQPVGGRTQD